MTPDVDDDDRKIAVLRKRSSPKFRYSSDLGLKDRDTRASSSLNKADNSCKY